MQEIEKRFDGLRKDTLRELARFEKKTKWTKIPCSDEAKRHVKLYEGATAEGKYLLRAHCQLDADPEKLLTLNIDNNYDTRKQWETGELLGIEQLQRLDAVNINIVRYWIHLVWPLWDREFIGIQWYKFFEKKGVWILVFRSAKYDEYYPCDTSKYQPAECFTIMKISTECVVDVFTFVDPCGVIPASIVALWKEKLRDRMLLYEKICRENFDEIYAKKWCENCEIEWGSFEDKCRKCHSLIF